MLELKEEDDDILSNLMKDCVEICGKLRNIPVKGFGPLVEENSSTNLRGKFETYSEFISHTIKEQKFLLSKMDPSRGQILEEGMQQLEDFFSEPQNSFQILSNQKSSLTIVDVNPANFIISYPSQSIVMIDLEVLVGANELFVMGSWMANLYGTRAYSHFRKHWGFTMVKQEETLCIAFGLLRILNIMIHLGLNTELDLEDIKPFGNHLSFKTLILEFCNILKTSQPIKN
ncbi:predicted protein [Naegleria gruberi]|uniref:Predicted protein n=1 Tax=Naegleria gruberi TaxID=5762 RepID=D2V266_NAEGR|nr:uncharacterized protein NAEGRDRAFT_62896 [Naegleria gruberi]EFC48852.1 predicted protein [Naegleria gruberi]|eukprot:XP_002681596.1 predicted protein [Naegleria gruberi strain NEG-M]